MKKCIAFIYPLLAFFDVLIAVLIYLPFISHELGFTVKAGDGAPLIIASVTFSLFSFLSVLSMMSSSIRNKIFEHMNKNIALLSIAVLVVYSGWSFYVLIELLINGL